MFDSSSALRLGTVAVITMFLAGAGFAPAVAMKAPEPITSPLSVEQDAWNCPLMRVGTQLVRCDNLTGAGASAPSWVPER